MALAEARAAWQRTANRCLVQEDAKRAPKLASCTSVASSPCLKQTETETEPTIADNNGQDNILGTISLPFNRSPSYSNLSPNSRRWVQMQSSYGYQKVLMDEQSSSPVEGPKNGDPQSLEFKDEIIGCEGLKSADEDDYFFDSESSWIRTGGKSTPWWRTADTEELALLVAQRSLDVIENCDLPRPQNTRIKKGMGIHCFSHDDNEFSTSLLVRKPGIGSLTAKDCNRELRKSVGDQLVFSAESSSSDSPTNEKMHALEGDSSRAQLLEALRHSQTRAREAEEVMKKACAEKEHVVKLVIRQASQIFAYKQWVHLLQLENTYFQFKNSKTQPQPQLENMLPWSGLGNSKMQKGWPLYRKRAKRGRALCDFGKYAIAFAFGLGLVGAGFLLGWTVGWMLPTW